MSRLSIQLIHREHTGHRIGNASKAAAILTLALAGTFGAGAGVSAVHAASPERICLDAQEGCPDLPPSLHRNQAPASRPDITLDATVTQRVLHVTGANFRPDGMVRLALVDVSTWTVIWRGSIRAQASYAGCPPQYAYYHCMVPNPLAGTINLRVQLPAMRNTANLVVLYHSALQTGTHGVTIQ